MIFFIYKILKFIEKILIYLIVVIVEYDYGFCDLIDYIMYCFYYSCIDDSIFLEFYEFLIKRYSIFLFVSFS